MKTQARPDHRITVEEYARIRALALARARALRMQDRDAFRAAIARCVRGLLAIARVPAALH